MGWDKDKITHQLKPQAKQTWGNINLLPISSRVGWWTVKTKTKIPSCPSCQMLPRSGFTLVSSTSSSLSNARGWKCSQFVSDTPSSFSLISAWGGPSQRIQSFTNCSNMHPSRRLQFFKNCSSMSLCFVFLRFLKHVLTESPPLSWCAQLWPAVGLLRTWNCLCLSWVSSLKPLLGWRQFCGKSHLTCTWHTRTMKTWYKCCPAVSIEYRYLTL